MSQVHPPTAHRLVERIARAQSAGRLPSLRAATVRRGEVCWRGAVGQTAEDPYDEQLRIGSITKTMTAVLIHQLVRDGRLVWDQPASDVLGDIGYADRTLRQLAAHSSGMQSEPTGSWWERSAGQTWEELAAGNDGSGAVFPTGQQFHYSNLGYALLGRIAAEVHGRSWFDCVASEILVPLGMTRTSYLPQGVAAPGWSVHPYAGTLTAEPASDTGAMAPAGQIWSTIDDLARYAVFLLEGHRDVLDRETLLAAAHPQAGDRHSRLAAAHGLGFALSSGGSGLLFGHTGSMPGFLAACLVDQERGTGAVVLANATHGWGPGGLATDLVELLEECEPSIPPAWTPVDNVPPAVAPVLGLWHWGNTPHVIRLVSADVETAALEVEIDGRVAYRFRLDGDRIIGVSGYHAGEELRVCRRPDGSVSHLDVATFILTREPYEPGTPIPGGHP